MDFWISMAPDYSWASTVCICVMFSDSTDAFVAPLSPPCVAPLSKPSSSAPSALQHREDSDAFSRAGIAGRI